MLDDVSDDAFDFFRGICASFSLQERTVAQTLLHPKTHLKKEQKNSFKKYKNSLSCFKRCPLNSRTFACNASRFFLGPLPSLLYIKLKACVFAAKALKRGIYLWQKIIATWPNRHWVFFSNVQNWYLASTVKCMIFSLNCASDQLWVPSNFLKNTFQIFFFLKKTL